MVTIDDEGIERTMEQVEIQQLTPKRTIAIKPTHATDYEIPMNGETRVRAYQTFDYKVWLARKKARIESEPDYTNKGKVEKSLANHPRS